MKKDFYLVISRGGSMRVVKSIPRLDWNEIAISMALELPDALFNRPSLQASITIPEDVVMKTPINAEIMDNVEDAIAQATGLNFTITVEQKEGEQ